jgi:hypothetical protein
MKRNSAVGSWLAIGIGTGISIGVALKNIGAGIAIGVGFGLSIGMLVGKMNDRKDKDKKQEDDL